MSAERLRAAAALLRERAEAATPGPWEAGENEPLGIMPPDFGIWMPEVGHDGALVEKESDATFIAMMNPTVALAVADWLDCYAAVLATESLIAFDNQALAVADAILAGGAS